MSLVADYGASSTESSTDNDSDSDNSKNDDSISKDLDKSTNPTKFPKPDFMTSTLKTSVFSNPYQEEEQAKQAILEKHVKMVPTKNDTVVINGKKICWNYRKGRCRFGHKCQFAHDSDLQKTEEELLNERLKPETIICQNNSTQEKKPMMNEEGKKNKKRPGLSEALVPGKKVMKMFHKQQKQPLC